MAERSHTQARLLVLVLCLFVAGSSCLSVQDDSEPFIGWSGESYKPGDVEKQRPSHPNAKWVELVSWKPRMMVYHNFLTEEECSHIKKLALPTMKRSTVVGSNGLSVQDTVRTSYGTFLKRRLDPIISGVEQRLAQWVQVPEVNGEDLQVLRYGQGQEYKPHMDLLDGGAAGPRIATILLYLNDVEEGGETAFPDSDHWLHPEAAKRHGPFSRCAQRHLAFKPRKGDAMMFWSIHPDGSQHDWAARHTGCPVLKGVKWTSTKWVHSKPFRPEDFGKGEKQPADPGHCVDSNKLCAEWAKNGECQHNAGYMIGDVGATGACRRSCKVCTLCKKGDMACYNANRAKLGYLTFDAQELGGVDAISWPS